MASLRTLTERNIGSLLVFEGPELRGIFTERDYVRWAARGGNNGAESRVGDIMDRHVHRIAPDQRVDEAMGVMTNKRVRHLVVEDNPANQALFRYYLRDASSESCQA